MKCGNVNLTTESVTSTTSIEQQYLHDSKNNGFAKL
jgi:hypothetical protein